MLGCNSITELNKPSSCVGSLGCVCVCVHSGGFVVQTRCAHTRTVARGIRLSSGFPSFLVTGDSRDSRRFWVLWKSPMKSPMKFSVVVPHAESVAELRTSVVEYHTWSSPVIPEKMKRFLLTIPENKKWVEAQEKRHKAEQNVKDVSRLVRREMFPELHPETVELGSAASSGSAPKEIVIEARQRQLHRTLMKELLKSFTTTGKQTIALYRTRTWEQKSKAIFFYFHKSLGNMDQELTCSLFSINVMTFQNWIKQKRYFGKWVHYVEAFKVSDILPDVPATYRKDYEDVDASSQVQIDSKFRNSTPGHQYVSALSAGTRQKNRNAAGKSDNITYLLQTTKTVGSGRKVKYTQQEEFLISTVVMKWETGNPLSKSAAYDLLISTFGHEQEAERTEWEVKMKIHSGHISPSLSQWVARVLERHRFSIRKESISQTVPVNWLQICLDACALICSIMRSAGVTRLVNADEMFLQFYPKETHLIAPTNARRVGSNRAEDAKKGCTVMVACEMFQSQIIAPMIIMTGQPDGTLSRRFSSWDGPSKVTFHPKHWMDKDGCCTYLEYLASCYPGEKVGLIWDAASSHFSDQVKEKAADLNITLGGIPPGCTSLIQVCDLIANKPIKQAFKTRYVSWKIASDPGPGGKYKVDRKDVISWLEQSIEDVNARMSTRSEVAKAFVTYGQDFRCANQSALAEYLAKHEENGVYQSLIDNQRSLDLE